MNGIVSYLKIIDNFLIVIKVMNFKAKIFITKPFSFLLIFM